MCTKSLNNKLFIPRRFHVARGSVTISKNIRHRHFLNIHAGSAWNISYNCHRAHENFTTVSTTNKWWFNTIYLRFSPTLTPCCGANHYVNFSFKSWHMTCARSETRQQSWCMWLTSSIITLLTSLFFQKPKKNKIPQNVLDNVPVPSSLHRFHDDCILQRIWRFFINQRVLNLN